MKNSRILSLPSNGRFYNDIVEMRELDVEFLTFSLLPGNITSETDSIYYTIKNYTNVRKPENLLYHDAVFLYNTIHAFSFGTQKKEKSLCFTCGKEHSFNIELSNISLNMLDKNSKEIIELLFDGKYLIKYRRRKLSDNIRSGLKSMELNEDNFIDKIILFFEDQFISLLILETGEETKDKNDLKYILSDLGFVKSFQFLSEIKKEDFGFSSIFQYNCVSCSYKNEINIFDPMLSSHIFTKEINVEINAAKESIKNILKYSCLNVMQFSDILKIPISTFSYWMDSLIDAKMEMNGKKNINTLDNPEAYF